MTKKNSIDVEAHRQSEFAKAAAEWTTLTDKDEWPESEHEARFNALTRKMLFMPQSEEKKREKAQAGKRISSSKKIGK